MPSVPPASGAGNVPSSQLFNSLAAIGPTQRTGRGAVLTLPSTSLFGVNSALLTQSGQSLLLRVVDVLESALLVNARVEGYTDSGGKADVNLKLSEARAKAVRDFLTSRGLGEDRVACKGYGGANPVAENTSADGRARNRRIEVVVAEGQIAEPDLQK